MRTFGTGIVAPFAGNGWMKTPDSGEYNACPCRVDAYATQRPFGEKVAPIGVVDVTFPNGLIVWSTSDKSCSVCARAFTSEKSRYFPSGENDSGKWLVSFAAVVSRTGTSSPSARCQKMPSSP